MTKENVLHSFYSEQTGRFYRLVKVSGDLPCLEISGIKMHCQGSGIRKSIKGMVSSLLPLKGKVLDCCFGQGYACLLLAESPGVEKVFSFEKDSNVLEIARANEFSKAAFSNPKITIENKAIEEALLNFKAAEFDGILHDPPSIKIAGELYSLEFYQELFRVLKKGGRLFHYVGAPGEKSGKNFSKGIIERLKKAGFKKIEEKTQGLGLLAFK